jgi:DNA-binding IclR family transcriptional regulator
MSKIVKRTLDFFELFAEQKRPLSLSEISRLLSMPPSSCYDVLQALEQSGYIYEIGHRAGYYPTMRLQLVAQRITDNDPVLLRAEMRLRQLRDQLDESVSLARINGAQATYLLVFEPSHPLRFMVKVGENVRSLYATSAGKAVLGNLDPEARNARIAEAAMTPLTDRTITDRDILRRDIEASIRRGWFLNREESVPGGTTISATFQWNRSLFVVTVAGPTGRMEASLDDVVARLLDACRDLENPGSAQPEA